MTWKEIKQHMWARRNAPFTNAIGKRSAKNKAKHVGVVLKGSRVQPQVRLERVFVTPK